MKEKGIIKSVSKDDTRCVYTFKKSGSVVENLFHLLSDLKCYEYSTELDFLFASSDEGEMIPSDEFAKIEDFTDESFTFSKGFHNISLIFGSKVCFLHVWAKDKQQEVSDLVNKYFKFEGEDE